MSVMSSVHRNADHKCIAMVVCVQLQGEYSDEWIWSLRPHSNGVNGTPFNIVRTSTFTRWQQLLVNRKQVVARDFTRAVAEKLGWAISDPRIIIGIDAGVGYFGSRDVVGSPREGMPYVRRDYQEGGGIAAR